MITLLKINALLFTAFVVLFFILLGAYIWSNDNDNFKDFMK